MADSFLYVVVSENSRNVIEREKGVDIFLERVEDEPI